ncbi:hypothetical protein [Xenorhabdus bovienii]|uniref:Uncharacterized protein n=1 Tax=Xenorhabdus bovienii str. Intermedium TaxID=1379677 RepID=A0A077QJP3_XENBV|nr:hypothetical protein [Xenorhabdus bovienii]CDH33764.1 hypothetical protein XBI1_2770020 [Xenorhabdus bovienii str. Intermedium]
MELHLRMWVETANEDVTAFEFADDGEKSTLIFDGKESLLLSLDKCQKIINAIRESIKE